MPKRLPQVIAVLVAVVCITAASVLAPWITTQREQLNLVYDVQEGDRGPVVSLLATAALGSFRGIAVNVLWYHAEHQKRAGRLFDANDTAQLITDLQPRFPQVWAFNAWNMAYNISVITHTPQERWNWVQKGVDLLRDRGIPANPTAVRLYRELGWIFLHKIGRWSDDMHWYYKQQLAAEWQQVLGPPPQGREGDRATRAFEPIAEAAERYFLFDRPPREVRDTLDALAEGLEDDDRLLAERLKALKWAGAEELNKGLARLIERYGGERRTLVEALEPLRDVAAERLEMAVRDPLSRLRRDAPAVSALLARLDELGYPVGADDAADYDTLMTLGRLRVQLQLMPVENLPPELQPLARLRVDPQHAEGWAALLALLRAKALTRHYHMDPAFMYELMAKYGPMDWRHPAAHGVYWSAMGIERSELLRSPENVDFVNTQRQVVHGLQALMHEGRLAFDPLSGSIDLLPDARFISAYEEAVFEGEEISALYRDLDRRESHFAQGHMNFLADAVVFAYLYGDEAMAQRYLDKLQNTYGEEDRDRFMQPLDRFFVTEYLEQGVPSRAGALALIDGRLTTAFSQGLAYARFDTFERQVGIAREMYDYFQRERSYITPNAPRERLSLPPFGEMVTKVFARYLESGQIDLLLRARSYQRAPSPLKQAVYAQVKGTLEAQSQQRGLSFDRAFPPPEGYVPPEGDADASQAPPDTPGTVERQ